jgi:NADPH-dependent glutamate synthase beta subunit-like oxidoreductase/NAD(P)H-flavin reductase
MLNPNYQLDFQDLYQPAGLKKVHASFLTFLANKNSSLATFYNENLYFNSDVLIELAIITQEFLLDLFNLSQENQQLQNKNLAFNLIYQARLNYIQRYIAKNFSPDFVTNFSPDIALQCLHNLEISSINIIDIELNIAKKIINNNINENLQTYCLWALFSKEGQKKHQHGALFILPKKLDQHNLLDFSLFNTQPRKDFSLCSNFVSSAKIMIEANYCLHCHKQKKDSCRTGLFQKNSTEIKQNELGMSLTGCPLGQKISEMNYLKSKGLTIASLVLATLDNPLLAGTGHRICNDCAKSCIFQQQDPVDIPQIETAILQEVLSLPYGFEIYSLLTRFCPLNKQFSVAKDFTNKKVLICGMGPAGYTLAHYLLNCGHEVVAIDGLKIEPLSTSIVGRDIYGNKTSFSAIKYWKMQDLNNRSINGFGGVAEYGITTRWNKNFLDIIYVLLARRSNFYLYSGIRFGSSITSKIAFQLYGFSHIAMCFGAGRPNFLDLPNNFAKGVRLASDFLMSLNLGAYQDQIFSNLQLQQPIVVVGGGLTAIDVACEAKVYYQVQVQRFAKKLQNLNYEQFFAKLDLEEKQIATQFLQDASLLANQQLKTNVSIVYRKEINKSPAYALNDLEVQQAINQGINIIEKQEIIKIITNEFGAVCAVMLSDNTIISCKALIFATGTSANISPALSDNLPLPHNQCNFTFAQLPTSMQQVFANLPNFINQINYKNYQAISFFGDLHPQFSGSVVKAMASAKQGYMQIDWLLQQRSVKPAKIKHQDDFLTKIHSIKRLSKSVMQIKIYAPLLVKNTKPGHIFRLQNYRAFAKQNHQQHLLMEGVAVTAIGINKKSKIITGMVLETGGSTSLIANFQPDDPCVFMGPSGEPTNIVTNQQVLLIGGGRGNQPLTALAKLFQKNGCKVFFFAGYESEEDIANYTKMQKSCHQLFIATKQPSKFFCGNSTDLVENYFSNHKHQKIDYIFTIGNNHMMDKVAQLRKNIATLKQAEMAVVSLNSPMQCMLKGVCGQCLQKRYTQNGIEYFFACASQDQNLDVFDFTQLHSRCKQNSLLEKISNIDYTISHL